MIEGERKERVKKSEVLKMSGAHIHTVVRPFIDSTKMYPER